MVRTDVRRPATAALRILALAAAYYVAARIGLLDQVVVSGAVVTPLWPPTGIALSCLLLFGLRTWPGIALGTFLVIATLGPLDAGVFGNLLGNTLGPVCACLMLRRAGFRVELDRLRDGVALVVLGAFAGMLISATLGTGTLLISGKLPASGFWPTWSAWWTGDAMGVLIVTPLLLSLRALRWPLSVTPRWAEASGLLIAAVGISLLGTRSSLALLFLVFPLIVWAALRFQLAGAAPCALIISVLAIAAATDRTGPFAGHSLFFVMVNLQALNASAALTALLLAATVTEQNGIRRKIEDACRELAEVVDRLAPGETAHHWPPDGRPPRRKDE
ncbi:MASE1 domain-containing protein [Streptomyces sp. SF28]|nr:MASE1 domain-containing protein [Streptomyces pinistramenti]MCB5911846.1 MASE1 domain-containing protein [Streptomyces pinistramenti]